MNDKILTHIEKSVDKIQADIVDIKVEQTRQGEHIDQNTKDLSVHILGVQQNRARIEVLEKTNAALNGMWKTAIGVSIIIGIIGGILTILVNIGRLSG